MNLSDSERVRTVLEGMGYAQTDVEEEADLLGLVSCSVRQRAIDRVYSRIARWNQWKGRRSLLTFATGCILPADREKLQSQFDLLFPITELPDLPQMIRQYGVVTPASSYAPPQASRDDPVGGFWKIRPRHESSFEAYIPIQNGCDKFCSFCAVPYTRGREVSRPSEDILAETEALIAGGYRSITLLGQNVNSYGLDRPGRERTFAGLLREIGEIGRRSGREFWVYFTSPHPRDMSREVVETIAAYPHLARQIHLPLQSGDDKVLIRMNRNHGMDRYREAVADIRELLPGATLFTDIIVGFPGETDEQYQNTRQAMLEFRYNMAFVAAYSPRPGAASARWPDDVPREVKNLRLHGLTDVLKETALEHNRALVGRRVRVLLTGSDRKAGHLAARTEGRIPVRVPCSVGEVGSFADVVITAANPLSLAGEPALTAAPTPAAT